jgi:hypothetical protein
LGGDLRGVAHQHPDVDGGGYSIHVRMEADEVLASPAWSGGGGMVGEGQSSVAAAKVRAEMNRGIGIFFRGQGRVSYRFSLDVTRVGRSIRVFLRTKTFFTYHGFLTITSSNPYHEIMSTRGVF